MKKNVYKQLASNEKDVPTPDVGVFAQTRD